MVAAYDHVRLGRVDRYYEMISGVRAALMAAGRGYWASRLLQAERGASTSGDAITRIGLVLEDSQGRTSLMRWASETASMPLWTTDANSGMPATGDRLK